MPIHPHPILYRDLVRSALKEDLGHGDVTTDALVPQNIYGKGVIKAKQELVLCGVEVAKTVFEEIDPELEFEILKYDGDFLKPGEFVATISGRINSILKGERVALNFLQHLSGVSTYTRRFVELVRDLSVKIVDTRKTLPGFRVLGKYAVLVGGGANHRFGLSDGVLIKDNHIKACGSVKEAILRAKRNLPHVYRIQIEVRTLSEVEEAILAGADALLLDNMDLDTLKKAVLLAKNKRPEIIIEASGGITLENVRAVAETGVDLVSIGRLTHSAQAVDLNLKIVEVETKR